MYILDTYKRATELGTYLVEHNSTVRATAGHFGISKSTVHKDITERLKVQNPVLYKAVSRVLAQNKNERHIRGGMATRLKYKKEKY
ncbi:MAG: sporulation transcriptional regulator SpoIIID [Eubacteriales bacterium]|nr:sporulation transcriptional regulator SpoIIID [Eubacteriales bacterium]MDD4422173.1 sporulation transcriptional regulator SpoIIID [Eubacteriales bacterium]HBR31761.1 stage III sporulation protein D [Clostridiales bacterium]